MSTPELRPLGVGEILDVSLKIAWRNAGTLVRIVLFVVLPAQILTALIEISGTPDYKAGRSPLGGLTSTHRSITHSDVVTAATAYVGGTLISFLAGQLATGASYKAVADSYLGARPSWRESLRFAARRLSSILWIVILGGILTVFGFVAFVIPGIYLSVAFAVALPALLTEGCRGRKALGRSRRLVRDRWWKTALVLLIAGILATIVGGVISGVVAGLALVHGGPVVQFAIAVVAGTAAALVTTPFKAAYVTVLYFDLRVRKEAFDLQLLAEQIGVEPAADGRAFAPVAQPAPAPGGDQPPFWPPPPGWKPGSGSVD